MDESIDFDFDLGNFVNVVAKIADGFGFITKKAMQMFSATKKGSQETEENMKKTGQAAQNTGIQMRDIFTKVLPAVGLLTAGFGAMRNALSQMPEIGRTFQFAGDVFMRNLLQPIREELLPILNKILSWVVENRTMFVQWGEALLNIFRVVFGVLKMLFDSVMKIGQAIMGQMESVFGGFTQGIGDTVRLVITKIAAALIFIMLLLEPIFEAIGKVIGTLVVGVRGFFEGFMEGAGPILDVISEIINFFAELVDELLGGEEGTNAFFQFMKRVGRAVAVSFSAMLKLFKIVLKFLRPVIVAVFELAKVVADVLLSAFEDWVDIVNKVVTALDNLSLDDFTSAFSGVADWFTENITDPIAEAFDALKLAVGGAFDWIIGKIESMISWFKDAWGWVKKFIGITDDAKEAADSMGIQGAPGLTSQDSGGLARPGVPTIQDVSVSPNAVNNNTQNNDITINQTNNVSGSDPEAIRREMLKNQEDIGRSLKKSLSNAALANGQ